MYRCKQKKTKNTDFSYLDPTVSCFNDTFRFLRPKKKSADLWMNKLFLVLTKMCINHKFEICENDESLLPRESVNTPAPSEHLSLPASYESLSDSARVSENKTTTDFKGDKHQITPNCNEFVFASLPSNFLFAGTCHH